MAEMSTGVADAVVVEIEGFEDRISQQSTISDDDGEEAHVCLSNVSSSLLMMERKPMSLLRGRI